MSNKRRFAPARAFLASVRTIASLERILAFAGAASAVTGLAQFVLPSLPSAVGPGLGVGALTLSALGIGIVGSRGRQLTATHPDRDWTIEIQLGNLFDYKRIAVTTDRAFNTRGIGTDSLLAQLLASDDGNGADTSVALDPRQSNELVDYGTTRELYVASKSVVLLAVSTPTNDGASITRWPDLWASYEGLWRHLRHSQTTEISIPVIGAGFAGATLDRRSVLSALVVSFHSACIESIVCRRLRIVLPAEDAGLIPSISSLLASLGYTLRRSSAH